MKLYQPIPTRDFQGDVCGAMGCEGCGFSWTDLEAACNQYPTACPKCEGLNTGPRYVPIDECANCGRRSFELPDGEYCSRRCRLQGEWAQTVTVERFIEEARP